MRKSRVGLGIGALALGLTTAAALQAPAAPAHAVNFVQTFTRAEVQKIIYDGAQPEVKGRLYWRTPSTNKATPWLGDVGLTDQIPMYEDGIALAATLKLGYSVDQFSDPNVDVNLNVDLSCDWRNPGIKVTLSDVDPKVAGGLLTKIMTFFTGSNLSVSTANIEDDLSEKVDSLLPGNGISFCPKMSVTSAGAVTFDFTPGDECSNGTTKTVACKLPTKGSGDTYTCVNGFWIWSDSHCVHPAPPPGEGTPPKGGAQK